jgi:radical SAM-linked protein
LLPLAVLEFALSMPSRFLYRLRFSKSGPARYFSHHDLLRLFERALRRADFPLSLSQGFNPRPRITFLSALPLGVESLDERVEIELSEDLAEEEFVKRLAAQFPEGLQVLEAARAGDRAAAVAAEYEADLEAGAAPDVAALLARPALPVERRSPDGARTVDIRPWIESAEAGSGRVRFTLRITDSGSARPDEVLKALGVAASAVRRTRLILASKGRAPGGEGR